MTTRLSNKTRISPSMIDGLCDVDKTIAQIYLPTILELIFHKLEEECDNDLTSPTLSIALSHAESIPSAQQSVFILYFQSLSAASSSSVYGTDSCFVHGPFDDKSKQQRRRRRRRPFHDALYMGNGRLVLRLWKNGCRWIHLNSNIHFLKSHSFMKDDETRNLLEQQQQKQSIVDLAVAEVTGYRIAQRIFAQNDMTQSSSYDMIQPDVLFFSQDDDEYTIRQQMKSLAVFSYPWAIFSYVGEHSLYYYYSYPESTIINTTTMTIQDIHTHQDDSSSLPMKWIYNSSFIQSMVRNRHEYGFIEAHPRHGRVCVDQCLDYALHLLDTIILPLHGAFFTHCILHQNNESSLSSLLISSSSNYWSANELLHLTLTVEAKADQDLWNHDYKKQLYQNYMANAISIKPIRYGDMIDIYEMVFTTVKKMTQSSYKNHKCYINQPVLDAILEKLDTWIKALHQENDSLILHGEYDSLPGVLCHFDLQPQNMVFRQRVVPSPSSSSNSSTLNSKNDIPIISSILDWEECCYADPRFELLLLCRKVVANRIQANIVWNAYSKKVEKLFHKENFRVGPILPWLRLESVHSIMTIIRHLCYSSPSHIQDGGDGRRPWENQTELFAKIEREFERLHSFHGEM